MTSVNTRSEDPTALDARTRLNNERGSLHLGAWIASHAGLDATSRLLDVGCGTGRLLFEYGGEALRNGRCTAADVSAASVDALVRAAADGTGRRIAARCFDMDELADSARHPDLGGFTHIVSAYALYYSAAPGRLLSGLAARLAPGGRLVVVAPAPGNNAEWFALLAAAGIALPPRIRAVAAFLTGEVLPFALAAFDSVAVEFAANTVRMETPDEIEAYWRSNIYYDPAATPALRDAAAAWCAAHGACMNRKRIGLVSMRNRSEE